MSAPLTADEKQQLLETLSRVIDRVDSGEWHRGGAVQRHISVRVQTDPSEAESDE